MALDPWSYAEKTGTEHAHQTALFMWANMAERFGLAAADDLDSYIVKGHAKLFNNKLPMPQLKWLHAIHNQGHGNKVRLSNAVAEGLKAGVSDLFLPVPMEGNMNAWKHGLYLELKVGKNTPSEIQLEFMDDMRAAGYAADWAVGWLEARQKILAYLQING